MQYEASSSPHYGYHSPTKSVSSLRQSTGLWSHQTYPNLLSPSESITQRQTSRRDLPNTLQVQIYPSHTRGSLGYTQLHRYPYHSARRRFTMDSDDILPSSFWDEMPPLDDTASWCRSASGSAEKSISDPSERARMPFSFQYSSLAASMKPFHTCSSAPSPDISALVSSPDSSENSQFSLADQPVLNATGQSSSIEPTKLWHRSWSSPSLSYHSGLTEVVPRIQLTEAVELPPSDLNQQIFGDRHSTPSWLPANETGDLNQQHFLSHNSLFDPSREMRQKGWNGFALVTQPQGYTPVQAIGSYSDGMNHLPNFVEYPSAGRGATQHPVMNQHIQTALGDDVCATAPCYPDYVDPNVIQPLDSPSNQSSLQLDTEGSKSAIDGSESDVDDGSGLSPVDLALSKHIHRYRSEEFLIKARRAGWSYRKIREKGNFKEKESTLRGRYRNLTKERRNRVRKPMWTERDIELLKEAVERVAPDVLIRKFDKKARAKSDDEKAPWSRVADYIINNGGSYHFGNATCRKKWDEVNSYSLTTRIM